MVEVGLLGDLTGDPGGLLAALSAFSQAPQAIPAARAGAALRASRTAALAWPASASGIRRPMAATIASASATARCGVTEGCETHQA